MAREKRCEESTSDEADVKKTSSPKAKAALATAVHCKNVLLTC